MKPPIKLRFILLIIIGMMCLLSHPTVAQKMTKERMAKILGQETTIVESTSNSWQVRLKDIGIMIIIDEKADRMRIISPAALVKDLKKSDYSTLLKANYHSALDARYAIEGEYVWSAFIHPLSPLNEEEFISALYQVRNLVLTYGTSYSSTTLVFGTEER